MLSVSHILANILYVGTLVVHSLGRTSLSLQRNKHWSTRLTIECYAINFQICLRKTIAKYIFFSSLGRVILELCYAKSNDSFDVRSTASEVDYLSKHGLDTQQAPINAKYVCTMTCAISPETSPEPFSSMVEEKTVSEFPIAEAYRQVQMKICTACCSRGGPATEKRLLLWEVCKVIDHSRPFFGRSYRCMNRLFAIALPTYSRCRAGHGDAKIPGFLGVGQYVSLLGLLRPRWVCIEFKLPWLMYENPYWGHFAGGFWLPFSSILTPSIGAYGHHSTSFSDMDSSAGLTDSTAISALFAFFLLTMGFLPLMVAICCFRTNICLAVVEWALTIASTTFWQTAQVAAAVAGKCLSAAGAFGFVACAAAWWYLFALRFASVDFLVQLRVSDIIRTVKGTAQKEEM